MRRMLRRAWPAWRRLPDPDLGRAHADQEVRNAQGLCEYNQMMMPFDDPSRLNDEQKWAIVAYMLMNRGAIGREATLDAGPAPRHPHPLGPLTLS